MANAKVAEEGDKVVYIGDDGNKIAGTMRQYLGESEEQTVILLATPQSDGARTIIVSTDKVEVVAGAKKKSAAKKAVYKSS